MSGAARSARRAIAWAAGCRSRRRARFPIGSLAAAAYHPGGLATDAPDSPHRLAGNIKARLFIGAAMEDANFDAAQQQRLREALDAAQVRYDLVEFPAKHGWVPSDTPVHDAAQAERHFETMFALFDAELRRA
jgi:carboxymethylenebutenolidase